MADNFYQFEMKASLRTSKSTQCLVHLGKSKRAGIPSAKGNLYQAQQLSARGRQLPFLKVLGSAERPVHGSGTASKKKNYPLRSPGEIQGKKTSFSNPQILSIQKKITHYWKSFKPECDVHHRHSTKRLQRQEEISPFYIAKWIQPITFIFAIFNCSFFQIFMTEGRIYNLESGDSWQISKCPPGNNTGPVEVHT